MKNPNSNVIARVQLTDAQFQESGGDIVWPDPECSGTVSASEAENIPTLVVTRYAIDPGTQGGQWHASNSFTIIYGHKWWSSDGVTALALKLGYSEDYRLIDRWRTPAFWPHDADTPAKAIEAVNEFRDYVLQKAAKYVPGCDQFK